MMPRAHPFFHVLGLAPETVDYLETWNLQRELHAQAVAGASAGEVLLLEHTSTYTAGKRTGPQDLPDDGSDVVHVDRGGKLTWHGPGQLVCYPVVRLADPAGVKGYVWFLEEVLIRTLADYGVPGERVEGRSGVWVRGGADEHGSAQPDRKIAAIGLRVNHGVSMHGFALNCSHSLEPYDHIIACGISDAGTTTISIETGRSITPTDVLDDVQRHFAALAPEFVAGGEYLAAAPGHRVQADVHANTQDSMEGSTP